MATVGMLCTDLDLEGERILEYVLAYDLPLGNMCLKKRNNSLITYRSGNIATLIDFVLFQKSMCKLATDVMTFSRTDVAMQHDDLYTVPNQAQIHSRYLPKRREGKATIDWR